MGPIVYDECTRQACPELDKEIRDGKISMLDPSALSVSLFEDLLKKYGLGDGETECIAYGKTFEYAICTDDKTARSAAINECGQNRVTGSIGLLKVCSETNRMVCKEAYNSYLMMKNAGGFLPKLDTNFFC